MSGFGWNDSQPLLVTIVGLTDTGVMTADQFGIERVVSRDIRPKGCPLPAEGERWIIERLGTAWVPTMMVGVPDPEPVDPGLTPWSVEVPLANPSGSAVSATSPQMLMSTPVTITSPLDVLVVEADLDVVKTNATAGTLIVEWTIASTVQPRQHVRANDAQNARDGISRKWRTSGYAPGVLSVGLSARATASGPTWLVYPVHSAMHVQRYRGS